MNLRSVFIASLATFSLCGFKSQAAEKAAFNFGIVNFTTCVTDSKYGKQEQEALESMRGQMTKLITDVEGQLNEISAKFNDADYLDGLSPEGEQELKSKYQSLRDEYERYQSQFYQILNQSNMKLIQTMSAHVNTASDKVSKAKKLPFVVNKDACFSYDSKYDVTSSIIEEMDKAYDEVTKVKNEQAKVAEAPSSK